MNANDQSIETADGDEIDFVTTLKLLGSAGPKPIAACPAFISVPLASLDFAQNDIHQVADMANVGYGLLQEISAYRPQYRPLNSPTEIIGDLIEEIANLQNEVSTMTRPAEAEQEQVRTLQFLTDVVTAAGLLAHGKTDKALAERIGRSAYEMRFRTN